jgi:hypothetical protein
MATTPKPHLTDEQLAEYLRLIADADSVELKLTIPESDQQAAVAELGVDPLDGQIRQVYFFDTPDLALNAKGVVARGRRVQGRGDDTVVKLRPVVPSEMPKKLRAQRNFVIEVDAMPGGFVCSGSLKGVPTGPGVRETVGGAHPLKKLFTKEQRAFYATHAPEGVALEDLAILGPIFVLKVKFSPPDIKHRLVGEMWLYPDNSRVLELSTKCAPRDSFIVAAELRAYLNERGVDLAGEQTTKTRKALEFFSERLRTA